MAATCQIMCDSTCDFTAEQAERENIRILPFHYVEAGKPDGGLSGDDDLFQSRSAHEFYDAIRRGAMPMTSQPSQLEYDEAFQAAYESGVPTVMFCISSGLSGGYQGACASLERLKEAHPNEEVRIYVIDSLIASTSLTLLLEEACRQRDAGLNAEQLVMWAEEARYHVHTIFMVDNLDALHRGGRLPKGWPSSETRSTSRHCCTSTSMARWASAAWRADARRAFARSSTSSRRPASSSPMATSSPWATPTRPTTAMP